MRAHNSKEINKGYLNFSLFLAFSVTIGVAIYYCTLHTNQVEVSRIVDKTEEYDKTYVKQIDLAGRIDSLYQYTQLFNTNLNDAHLLNSVSRRKQEILSLMEDMSSRDVRLYQKLMSQVNTFLSVKDSIGRAKTEEDLIKTDLLKCSQDHRQASRQLTIGSITINR